MTYPISDSFSDSRGRWNALAPWDDSIFVEHASGTAANFLATQEHVDLRSFRAPVAPLDIVAVPQFPDLDLAFQSSLDSLPQTSLELKGVAGADAIFSENWTTSVAHGGITQLVRGQWDLTVTYSANDIVEYQGAFYKSVAGGNIGNNPTSASWTSVFFVGKIAARGGWNGLQMTTDGAALNVTLESKIPADNVDISAQNSLSVVFPDFNTFTSASCYVQLSSSADGSFGSGHDSAQVLFTANTAAMPELRVPVSSFAAAGFDNTAVTGVRIHLAGSPGAAQTITVMAVRAVKTAWVASALDFDTRWGIVKPTPTLSGAIYGGTVAAAFEFIRGDGTPLDPYPADGAYTIFFHPGGSTSPTDAGTGTYNQLALILREKKDSPGVNGSGIYAYLEWKDNQTRYRLVRRDMAAGVETDTTVYTEVIDGASGLNPANLYAWTVKLVGKSVSSVINAVNTDHQVQSQVWTAVQQNSDDYTFRNGRVGFMANLKNRDAYVDLLDGAPTGFAILRTRSYASRTPVDGAQLQAVFAPDDNLVTSVDGPDAFRDQTKTITGDGAIRTLAGVTTNQFPVDDWNETYLESYLWVPAAVTRANQPVISLRFASTDYPIPLPALQPSQWNYLKIELRQFHNLITGLNYQISFAPDPAPDTPLGFFWVDGVKVGRRKVAWSIRATPTGPFRRFYGFANDPNGAVHLNPNERGRDLQLVAEALTSDAWIRGFTLLPRYAELGLPLYDKAFETR